MSVYIYVFLGVLGCECIRLCVCLSSEVFLCEEQVMGQVAGLLLIQVPHRGQERSAGTKGPQLKEQPPSGLPCEGHIGN